MDIADRSQWAEEQERKLMLENRPAAPSGPSATHCEECGNEIPQARREAVAGCKLCITCQTETEKEHGI
ncbi:MAG: TraR/DksA C4-type zinc finger protein [Desulfovibrio sp.]